MAEQRAFIETQFPISKLCKESYKERMGVQSQTLTGLGKWWGRKPLLLVRAAILGVLLPSTDNPQKDTDIFLRLLSMDKDGLARRQTKRIPVKKLYEYILNDKELKKQADKWFVLTGNKVKIAKSVKHDTVEKAVFNKLTYDQKLAYCVRPEELPDIGEAEWKIINTHLGTHAHSLAEIMQELSQRRFQHKIVVGDCFAGGGSIPFEAFRMGADVVASDLNSVAGLLTWADLAFSRLSHEEKLKLEKFQEKVYEYVDRKIVETGVETAENGDRGNVYLYCTETVCPECGYTIPLAPSWLIGAGSRTVAILEEQGKGFRIRVKMDATAAEMKNARSSGTVRNSRLLCPHCHKSTPLDAIRKDYKDENGTYVYGLRKWEQNEFDFRPDDVFHERLYVIRYEHIEQKADGKIERQRYYVEPSAHDWQNERRISEIVKKNISRWQSEGILPFKKFEEGYNTDQPIRERGWTYWHQLFNPRQLLVHAFIQQGILELAKTNEEYAYGLLCLHRCCNWNSKLCSWGVGQARESMAQTFYNNALNTMWNYGARGLSLLEGVFYLNLSHFPDDIKGNATVKLQDARDNKMQADVWITDPPYADAVNYHEVSEFFIAWDKAVFHKAFPDWYADSKRVLAVRGGENFAQTMIEIYANLTRHMPDDGMQIVMFTHSDPAVWAQLAIIMWRAGLRVTAAWNIATETDASGLKKGNYVKGTVLLVLRKQTGSEMAFLDEINGEIRGEVERQIESMRQLDDQEEPNFSDPDFVLAAYAASLKVLTAYAEIEDLDLDFELNKAITDPAHSQVVALIENAKKIAYDCVIPAGFDQYSWRQLTSGERFYIKGVESEKYGDYQIATYQEYARGFSISGYSQLMASERANSARLMTPEEMAGRTLSDVPTFQDSLLRTVCQGIYVGIREEMNPLRARDYIKTDLPNYWDRRELIMQLLHFFVDIRDIGNMQPHWTASAEMAAQLLTVVQHDGV